MDARELPRTFRIMMIANIVFAIIVTIVLGADYIPALGFVLNPHSQLGGVSLLVMLLITLITFGTLLFYSPKSIVMLKQDPGLRTVIPISISLAGIITASLIALWLTNFVIRLFVVR